MAFKASLESDDEDDVEEPIAGLNVEGDQPIAGLKSFYFSISIQHYLQIKFPTEKITFTC